MKIGERGQVTIPHKLRRRFGLKPKAQVEFVEMDGMLVLRKLGGAHAGKWERSYGLFKTKDLRTDDLMRELRDR